MHEETGIEPKALKERPVLNQRWVFAKGVFDDLSGSRQYTAGGPANIPISEYDVYARGYGFSRTEWTDTWEDLALIDTLWLIEVGKKQKAEQKST